MYPDSPSQPLSIRAALTANQLNKFLLITKCKRRYRRLSQPPPRHARKLWTNARYIFERGVEGEETCEPECDSIRRATRALFKLVLYPTQASDVQRLRRLSALWPM